MFKDLLSPIVVSSNLNVLCIGEFSSYWDQIPDKKQLNGGVCVWGVYFGCSLWVQPSMAGWWHQDCGSSQDAEMWALCLSWPLLFWILSPQPVEYGSSLCNTFPPPWKYTHRHTQRCISMLILNLIELTMKICHHTFQKWTTEDPGREIFKVVMILDDKVVESSCVVSSLLCNHI